MELNERLRELRKGVGYSQAELAKRLGVSPATIGMYETGERKPSYKMLETLADFYNVDIDYLTGRSDQSTYYTDPVLLARQEMRDDVKALADLAAKADPENVKMATAFLKTIMSNETDN